VFNGLSESLQATIKKSPEYLRLTSGALPASGGGSQIDDEIPF
jgi:hypothetical protein